MSVLRVTLALALVVHVMGDKTDNKDFVPTNNKTEAPGEKVLARSARGVGEFLEGIYALITGIYPGTLWCGKGNNAFSYEQLGTNRDTDKCCREHDHCPLHIESGYSREGLTNYGLITRSDCGCDIDFYVCLKKVDTHTSLLIGNIYFNVLAPKCLWRDKPFLSCYVREGGYFASRCYLYVTDESGSVRLQFHDNPYF